MNSDPVEDHLAQRQTRRVPREWREQILNAAREAAAPAGDPVSEGESHWYRSQWLALAAAWVIIAALQWTSGVDQGTGVRAPVVVAGWEQHLEAQRRLLAELVAPSAVREEEEPRPAPRSSGALLNRQRRIVA